MQGGYGGRNTAGVSIIFGQNWETWTRTRITCSRGMCPTIRRSPIDLFTTNFDDRELKRQLRYFAKLARGLDGDKFFNHINQIKKLNVFNKSI